MLKLVRGSHSSGTTKDKPFLHVKFGDGRPPEYGHQYHFAHQLSLLPQAEQSLPDGLQTDVQREGIGRYLTNNFKQGSPVWEIVREREKDESTYILCTSNWHRSSGDQKLHLSLYVYKEDRYVSTWHAYTDRTLSLARPGGVKPPTTTPYTTPDSIKAVQQNVYTPKPTRGEEEEVVRNRLDRPTAAPPEPEPRREEEEEDDESQIPPPRSSASQRPHQIYDDNSDSEVAPPPPRKPPAPAVYEEDDDEGYDDDYRQEPAPSASRTRSERAPERPNPHARAPVSSSAASATSPTTSRASPARTKGDAPAVAMEDDWDAPPPEENRPPTPEDSWIVPPPPADSPQQEGFEALWEKPTGDHKPSLPDDRPPPSRRNSMPPRRDDSHSPERAHARPSSRHGRYDSDDEDQRGRSSTTEVRSSRRPSSIARPSAVDEEAEALKRRELELEERERKLAQREKEREEELERKVIEKLREKKKERRAERQEREGGSRRERDEEEHQRERSPSPPPSRRKSVSAPPAEDADEPPPRSSRRRASSKSHQVAEEFEEAVSRSSRRPPPPEPSAPPPEEPAEPTWSSTRRSAYPKDDSDYDKETKSSHQHQNSLDNVGGFDPSSVRDSTTHPEDEPPAQPPTVKAALGGWFKGIGEYIKGQPAGTATESVDQEPEEDEEALEEERRRRKRARRERRKKREAELVAAAVAVATGAAVAEVEHLTHKKSESRSYATDAEDTEAEEPRESHVSRRSEAENGSRSTRRAKSIATDAEESEFEDTRAKRRSKPSVPDNREEEAPRDRDSRRLKDGVETVEAVKKDVKCLEEKVEPSSGHRRSRSTTQLEDQDEPRHSRTDAKRSSRHSVATDVEEDSDREKGPSSGRPEKDGHRRSKSQARPEESEYEDEPQVAAVEPPAERPSLRQRAMSFTQTVDAGFKGLRDSVTKSVETLAKPKESTSSSPLEDTHSSRSRRKPRREQEEPAARDDDDQDSSRRSRRKSRKEEDYEEEDERVRSREKEERRQQRELEEMEKDREREREAKAAARDRERQLEKEKERDRELEREKAMERKKAEAEKERQRAIEKEQELELERQRERESRRRASKVEDDCRDKDHDRHSRRQKSSSAATDGEESDAPSSRRSGRNRSRDTDGEESDAAVSAPRNSSSSSSSDKKNKKKRQDTDELTETEFDKLAKANTKSNSSTVPLEEAVRKVQEPLPNSPSSNHPLSVREELRQLNTRSSPQPPAPLALHGYGPTSPNARFTDEVIQDSRGVSRVRGESYKRYRSLPPSPTFGQSSDDEPIHNRFNQPIGGEVLEQGVPPRESSPLPAPIPQRPSQPRFPQALLSPSEDGESVDGSLKSSNNYSAPQSRLKPGFGAPSSRLAHSPSSSSLVREDPYQSMRLSPQPPVVTVPYQGRPTSKANLYESDSPDEYRRPSPSMDTRGRGPPSNRWQRPEPARSDTLDANPYSDESDDDEERPPVQPYDSRKSSSTAPPPSSSRRDGAPPISSYGVDSDASAGSGAFKIRSSAYDDDSEADLPSSRSAPPPKGFDPRLSMGYSDSEFEQEQPRRGAPPAPPPVVVAPYDRRAAGGGGPKSSSSRRSNVNKAYPDSPDTDASGFQPRLGSAVPPLSASASQSGFADSEFEDDSFSLSRSRGKPAPSSSSMTYDSDCTDADAFAPRRGGVGRNGYLDSEVETDGEELPRSMGMSYVRQQQQPSSVPSTKRGVVPSSSHSPPVVAYGDSDAEGFVSRYSREKAPSPPSVPPSASRQQQHKREPSFSRTGPSSYPFSDFDEDEDLPATVPPPLLTGRNARPPNSSSTASRNVDVDSTTSESEDDYKSSKRRGYGTSSATGSSSIRDRSGRSGGGGGDGRGGYGEETGFTGGVGSATGAPSASGASMGRYEMMRGAPGPISQSPPAPSAAVVGRRAARRLGRS
ncbi:hypothetical protein T439DRAFT_209773 [Meredithblackwellia eburnea MCA 4105]